MSLRDTQKKKTTVYKHFHFPHLEEQIAKPLISFIKQKADTDICKALRQSAIEAVIKQRKSPDLIPE